MHIYLKRPQPIQVEKVQAEQLKFDAVYTIEGQKYEGKAGDWLVLATKNDKLSVNIMSDADFNSQYANEVTVDDFTSTIEEFNKLFTRSFFTRSWLR
jgi:uncharacterized iron-regulated membrane protein